MGDVVAAVGHTRSELARNAGVRDPPNQPVPRQVAVEGALVAGRRTGDQFDAKVALESTRRVGAAGAPFTQRPYDVEVTDLVTGLQGGLCQRTVELELEDARIDLLFGSPHRVAQGLDRVLLDAVGREGARERPFFCRASHFLRIE